MNANKRLAIASFVILLAIIVSTLRTSPNFAFCASWVDSLHFDASWHLTENDWPVADCNGWVEFGE